MVGQVEQVEQVARPGKGVQGLETYSSSCTRLDVDPTYRNHG